jgi:sn-glycerol 3-phosphate transport system ATP-binding protein
VVLLREGRIEQEGSPEDLYGKPATVFAARFIGTPGMNLVALADGPRGAVIRGSADALFPGKGEGLTLGVRPEHVAITDAGGVAATVSSREYHGADTILTVQVGDESLLVRSPGQLAQAPGSRVRVAWKPGSMHLFDARTGLRVEGAAVDGGQAVAGIAE